MVPHPLAILSAEETNIARDVVVACHPDTVIDFREIYLLEPPKAQLREFLALEHAGRLSPTTPRPPRMALCQYDVIGCDRIPSYQESAVDVGSRKRVKHQVIGKQHHAALTVYVNSFLSHQATLLIFSQQRVRCSCRSLLRLPAVQGCPR